MLKVTVGVRFGLAVGVRVRVDVIVDVAEAVGKTPTLPILPLCYPQQITLSIVNFATCSP